jgi:hypothetical protein
MVTYDWVTARPSRGSVITGEFADGFCRRHHRQNKGFFFFKMSYKRKVGHKLILCYVRTKPHFSYTKNS